ncbi:MAG: tetratricopeptide repeat protein [Candidatus Melainabacteria bacterium]|nr:tetratricopeptide repeat protein [Candidatus Melainabacteria bacterium]
MSSENLKELKYADKPTPEQQAKLPSNDPNSGSQVTYEQNIFKEQAVADGCLKAWRKAVNDKDEAAAMKMLEELDNKYTGISSVQFMMGQVKDHFGKHKEAVVHFRRAHSSNQFSSMQTFKLAESLRKSGDAKGSIVYYKKLVGNLETATGEFGQDTMVQLLGSVRLGLAKAYSESGQKDEALVEVKKVLEKRPEQADAKSLLKELEKTAK